MTDILSWIRLAGPFLVGHRGFPRAARENTVPSFEAALESGCDGVELDVRLTRDGILVVHHDERAIHEKGSLLVEESDWESLRGERFRAGSEEYGIPRLDAVLRAISGRCLLNVEVKPPAKERTLALAAAVSAALDRVRPRESVLVSSFDVELLGVLRRQEKALLLGFLFSSLRDFNHLEESEVADSLAAIHPRHDLVDEGLMGRARDRGLDVHAWTVDDPQEVRRVVGLGVTSVITNRPDLCGPVLFEGLPPE
jgi:glycerophosphoryl diester phosphodiesterase